MIIQLLLLISQVLEEDFIDLTHDRLDDVFSELPWESVALGLDRLEELELDDARDSESPAGKAILAVSATLLTPLVRRSTDRRRED